MKTKKSIWSVALSFIIMFALVLGINLTSQSKVVNADVTYDGHIKFDVKVDDVESKAVSAGYAGDLVVTYTVTETTGVDALQLKLGYDHDAFTLNSVVTNNATTLGGSTKGKNGDIDNDNVVYENVDTEGVTFVVNPEDNGYQPVLLITATFNLNHPTQETTYTFSLYNVNDEEEDELGSYSTAWKIKSNAQNQNDPAKLNPVEIQFVNEATVYVKGTYNFTLADAGKIYDGVAGAVTVSDNDNAHRPAINYVWFVESEYGIEKLNAAPVDAGTYYVAIDYLANDYYDGYVGYEETSSESGLYILDSTEGKVAEYVISPRSVNVTIDSKESAYGETLKPLTFTVDPQTPVIGNDNLGISLFSDANSLVPGTSPITGSAGNANYIVSFTNGTYTVTARNVTIIIADKSSVYGAPLAELTYTIDANTPVVGTDDLGISLQTTATVNSNVGTYDITGSATNGNYNVTFRNTSNTATKAVYTITSQNINAFNYFTGDTATFDANSHDLLIVSNEKPNWVSYTAENNNQTNANTYTITITATIGTQDALNYLSSDLLAQLEQTENGYKYVTTVEGKINPKAETVTADNKSHVYGNTPATLTPVTVGVNNEVTVNFVVKNANEETITLSTETPVGTYTIVPSATNSNYAFTFNPGTYTVSKVNATISISAENIIYNRELDYTVSNAKVGSLDAPYTVEIRNSNNQVVTGVLPVGDYTIIATVAGTDNYNGATAQATFTVIPNVVGKPIVDLELEIEEIHFDKDTVTWEAVTKDTFGNDLYNTTVTYRIGGVEYNNRSFTATSDGSYVLEIISSNENYLSNQVTLTVYSVTFTEGSHPASSTAEVEGLPATQYRFEGETATQPNATPTVAGYTFNGWDFDFETEIEENTEIPALWTIQQRTITVIVKHNGQDYQGTFTDDYNAAIDTTKSITQQGNLVVRANLAGMIDTHYDKDGMHYTFANSWNYKVTGSEAEYAAAPASVNATENYTFIAVYNATPIEYEITYYFSIDGAPYTQSIVDPSYLYVNYGSTINYVTPNSQKWFRVEAWYTDAERTQVAPVTMPAHDLTVYGALVFNVGKGDVNGDGYVDANDITLYRRWIVGGYEITALLNNNDLYEASEMETEDPSDTVYFIARVADTNAETFESVTLGDGSKDIRDVSTIRMGLVGGYGFSIVEGVDVTGEDLIIVREFEVESATDLLALARSGAKVTLSEDITNATLDAEILNSNKDIIIDLHGHTLTLKSFRVTLAQGNTGKILVTNGRINVADGNGVYLTAVDGSVHLDNVTLYDDNGLFVIQTADHSLHLFNVVRFLKREIVNNVATEVAAVVNIADKTHIVVEPQANLIVEKLVVEQNAEISITVNSAETAIIAVEGTVEVENNVAETKVYAEDNALLALVKAAKEGGEFTLEQDYEISEPIIVEGDLVLNLNGHNIYNTKDIYDESKNAWSLISVRGGNLTINGNGELLAKANDCYAIDVCNNGTLTVNGGTYTGNISAIYAHDGFVTVNGGEFAIIQKMASGDANRFMLNCYDASYKNGISNFTVNGGTFNGFNPADNASELGGHTNYVTEKHYVEENNGVYTVKEYGKIANKEELLSAVENGGKYQLVADFTVDQTVEITKDFTLEGNNHTITFVGGDAANKIYYAFYVVSENVLSASFSNLNILSTGYQVAIMTNLDAEGSLVNVNNVDITCDGECIYSNGYGVVNAVECDFTRNGEYATGKDVVYYSALLVGYAGTINATDCTVNSDRNGVATFPSGGFITLNNTNVTANGNGYAIWARNEDYNNVPAYNTDSVITINSGNIVGEFKITDKYTTGDKNLYEPKIVVNGGTYNVDPTAYVADKHYVEENNGVYTVKEYAIVETLEELQAALVGDEKYIGVTNQIVIDEDVTLDLNGKTICYVGSTTIASGLLGVKRGATLTINDTVGTGKINASQKVYAAVALTILGESATGEKAALIVNGGTLEGYYYAVVGNGSRHNTEITINNGTLYGLEGTAIYNPQDGLVTINNGHLKGYETAIEIRAGQLVINGGEFEALTEETTTNPNGSGTTTVGAIIAVSQHTTLKEINVEIKDGTFVNGVKSIVVYDSTGHNKELITVTITGGKFKDNPEAYVAEGYKSVHVEDEEFYWVVDKDAIIGGGQDPIVGPGPNPSSPF